MKFTDHPNQEQYKQYEEQWKTYETQMNQKRRDIEQRKASLENQLKQAHANNPESAPGAPQMPYQWNNQQNQGNNQGNAQRSDNYRGRGSDNFPGGSQFSGHRGPVNQGPRFDAPQQSSMGSQRFGGPRHGYDPPRAGGTRSDGHYDQQYQEMNDAYNLHNYNYNDDSVVGGNMRGNNRRRFGSENYDNTEQYDAPKGNRFPGPRSGGSRNSRFEPRAGLGPEGPRFEHRGDAGRGGPRPGGGPVPLMDLNIEKPRTLEHHHSDEHFDNRQGSGTAKPVSSQFRNADEELMSKMGLPTTFGGNINEEDEDQPQPSNQFKNNQSTGPSRSRWGPRDPPVNRQSSQEDRQFGPRATFGGPRGPLPTGPRGHSLQDAFARDPRPTGPRGPCPQNGFARDPRPTGPRGPSPQDSFARDPKPTGPREPFPQDPFASDPSQSGDRPPWEADQDWDHGQEEAWKHLKDRQPVPHLRDGSTAGVQNAQQKQDSVDPNKVSNKLDKN